MSRYIMLKIRFANVVLIFELVMLFD